jgi:hypothetical protein
MLIKESHPIKRSKGLDNHDIAGAFPSNIMESSKDTPVNVGRRRKVGSHHILANPVSVALFNSFFNPSIPSFRYVREKAATVGPHAAGLPDPSKKSAIIDVPSLPLIACASSSQNSQVNA